MTLAQQAKFGIIVEPEVELSKSEINLKSIIEDINARDDLDLVIVLGNISTDGSTAELNKADNILSELIIPYYIAPGPKDVSIVENGGINFSQIIGRDGFSFSLNDIMFLTLNSMLPFNKDLNFLNVDEIKWINDFFSSAGLRKTILFSSNKPQKIENLNELNNTLTKVNHSVMITVSEEKEYSREFFSGMELINLSNNNDIRPEYYILKVENDSLYVLKRQITDQSDFSLDQFLISPYTSETTQQSDIRINSDIVKILKESPTNETHITRAVHSDGITFLASKNGDIRAIDNNLKIKWEYYTGGTIFHSPERFKDILVATIVEGDLIVLNSNNGDVLHVIGLPENITAPPLLIDIKHNGYDSKGIIITTLTGHIYCYEAYSLELVWSQKTIKGTITTVPAIHANILIFANTKGEVFALSSETGSLIWKYKIISTKSSFLCNASPIVDNKNVYVRFDQNIIVAIDLLRGALRWIHDDITHQQTFSFTLNGDILIKGNENNFIIISSSNGKIKNEFPSLENKFFPNNFLSIGSKFLIGISTGDILLIDENQKVTNLFNSFNVPIISLSKIDDQKFLSLDLNGNIVVFQLKLSEEIKH
jgi:outer membrane protein assembly factor BamB